MGKMYYCLLHHLLYVLTIYSEPLPLSSSPENSGIQVSGALPFEKVELRYVLLMRDLPTINEEFPDHKIIAQKGIMSLDLELDVWFC